jgi:Clp amino terminal domain, pathogenicity island component
MFERFTKDARHVVVLAQEEARRLHHNYIGTEHILLGLLAETDGLAFRALQNFGFTLEGTRDEVTAIIAPGGAGEKMTGHIPFTPRAKKTLELALRESLQLHHNYIGTEHVLLGVIREGNGVAAQVLKQHADLSTIRSAVLDLAGVSPESRRTRLWLRRVGAPGAESAEPDEPTLQSGSRTSVLSATPAADTTLSEAGRLAGAQPVGSHHLLLAALADINSAAARALAALGLDLDRAKEALRTTDVTGTSDELPEEAGRRQMVIHVADDRIELECSDRTIIEAGQAAIRALTGTPEATGTIRGDQPGSASLGTVWQALADSLGVIERRATLPAESPPLGGKPDQPGDSGEAA